MGDAADRAADQLSEGLRRRLSVGIAFLGAGHVGVLDEPTSGVDPAARTAIHRLILSQVRVLCPGVYCTPVQRAGRTLIVSTHHMEEAETLCAKLAVLHQGRLLRSDQINLLSSHLVLCSCTGSGHRSSCCWSSARTSGWTSSPSLGRQQGSVLGPPTVAVNFIAGFLGPLIHHRPQSRPLHPGPDRQPGATSLSFVFCN